MSPFEHIQQQFLERIKNNLPSHLSMVDEISDCLEISTDSTYRRLRGETALSIEEVYKLSDHFSLSLDSFFSIKNNAVLFESINFIDHDFDSRSYLNRMLKDIRKIASYEDKEIIYAAKDIPIFHLFVFPEIATFKSFFWTKTIASVPSLEDVKFSLLQINQDVLDLCSQILEAYLKIPSKEIWSDETITSLLRQIEYYWDCDLFESNEDALVLCQKIEDLIHHIQKQATVGAKFIPEGSPINQDNFDLYWNEVILPDNTILSVTNGNITTHISHDVMDYLITTNERFSKMTYNTVSNLMKRSELISKVSEKNRNTFFKRLRTRAEILKQKIITEQ